MAEQSRRFVSPDKPIDKFIEDQKNKNTLSKTRRDVSLLTEFLNSKNQDVTNRYFRYSINIDKNRLFSILIK